MYVFLKALLKSRVRLNAQHNITKTWVHIKMRLAKVVHSSTLNSRSASHTRTGHAFDDLVNHFLFHLISLCFRSLSHLKSFSLCLSNLFKFLKYVFSQSLFTACSQQKKNILYVHIFLNNC